MASEFRYLDERQEPCTDLWPDTGESALLSDWGIEKISSLEEMENWYESAHIGIALDAVGLTIKQSEQPQVTALELKFKRLKKEWIRKTERLSNLSQIVLDPSYQQIIAIGPPVIPFILKSLQSELDHWFWALKMLNEDMDVAEGTTTLSEAAAAWIKWGRENGHLDSGK